MTGINVFLAQSWVQETCFFSHTPKGSLEAPRTLPFKDDVTASYTKLQLKSESNSRVKKNASEGVGMKAV